jgi:hypothetical protein
MAIKKQNTFTTYELSWLEDKAKDLQKYVDDNPISELKDRIEWKPTGKGGVMPMVIATIESQIKSIRDTQKDYVALIESINKLRESEERRAQAIGNRQISGLMEDDED